MWYVLVWASSFMGDVPADRKVRISRLQPRYQTRDECIRHADVHNRVSGNSGRYFVVHESELPLYNLEVPQQ